MKRVQEDVDLNTDGGPSPCALRHHPTKKKARLSSPDENDAAAPAPLDSHTAARLSDLPDLVHHHLVRELAVGDAIRLRATSSFWADLVVRNHPLARFVLVDLLPLFAGVPPPR